MKLKKAWRNMLLCTGFAAFTGVMAQLEIPLPLIPISGQTLAVGLSATVLGSLQGASAMIIYAGMGLPGYRFSQEEQADGRSFPGQAADRFSDSYLPPT
ncbi:biotin transporter BioY [Halobacillus sp. BAB-2008]|uniref:biotin transporter BioY n=1 Tax=Halobacillus sp. BAB-2008 TaxID=1246484 RepID=UPI0002ED60A6|nr:biotin transporter BioY [Halobacillus sp. BAB-2008]